MNDSAPHSDEPSPVNLSMEERTGFGKTDLERRVQRLEDDVTALKDTKAMEERVAARVTERLQKTMGSDKFTATPPIAGSHGAFFSDDTPSHAARGNYAWLFFDMITDARLLFLMLTDRRYALAWTTHLVVWLFIPAILTSGWWFPVAYIPLFGPYLDKVLDLLLAFCVYKALSREVRRYRDMHR